MNWQHRFAGRTHQMKRTAVRELLKLTAQPGMISFAGGLPAPELFPIDQVKHAAEAVLSRIGQQALQYGETEGVAELRDWIAAQFSHSQFRLTRANVGIVSGGQQALDLIGRVLLDEQDKVVVENPTYLALLSAWRPLGVQFLPVQSDANGMRVDELESLLQERPKLIYTLPNFQNPQGTTLDLERRVKLVELSRQHDVGLVEDNPYGELRYSGDPLPHLIDLDVQAGCSGTRESFADGGTVRTETPRFLPCDGNVIYVGTFSKVLMPGLRVGWVIAAEPVIEKMVQAKQAADLHTSTLNQYIALELLRNGVLEQQIPLLRQAYRVRRDAMLVALQKHFPADVTWTRPDGGMFLMVTLPMELSAAEVLQASIPHNVAFVPGEDFHLNGAGQNTFRLNFSNARPDLIDEGIKRLGNVLKRLI